MKILVVFTVLLLVAVVFAQEESEEKGRKRYHRPCRSPPVWESNFQEYAYNQGVVVLGRYSYDGLLKRVRVVEAVLQPKTRNYYDILYLHRWGIMYVLDMKTRNCTRTKINKPWVPMSAPANSSFIGSAYVGTAAFPLAGVEVSTWGANVTVNDIDSQFGLNDDPRGKTETGRLYATFTRYGCLPVSQMFISKKYGTIQANFNDITLGLVSPKVFMPPKECYRQSQVYPMMDDYIPEMAKKRENEAVEDRDQAALMRDGKL